MPANPPIVTRRLGLWWVFAAGIALALVFGATDHMVRCTVMFAATLIGCALLRLVLPMDTCGGLVVRRKWLDVTVLLVLGSAVLAVGLSLDLTAQV